MKLNQWILIAASFAPALAAAQNVPPAIDTKVVFSIMQKNVANIKQPLERERWDANVAMWQVVLSTSGKLTPGELDLLKTSLERIKSNAVKIMPAGEEQRWIANIALWQAYVEGNRPPNAKNEVVYRTFEKMKDNVSRLNDSQEKRRWEANIDLWQVQLTPQP